MQRRRIFGIGLNKTGTSSLKHAYRALGLRDFDRRARAFALYQAGDLPRLFNLIDGFEAFQDWPWPLLVPDLLARYPDAQFILTRRRSPEAWVESLKAHALRTHPDNNPRLDIYGHAYPHGREAEHVAFYLAHQDAVRALFADRADQLLEVCWEEGDSWERLCGFLGRPVPSAPFPHANRAATAEIDPARRAENLRRIAQQSER